MRPFILAICCILQIFGDLWGQSYSSVHYDTKSGLPSNTVYDISQDKYGFIWFATENGLSRFDGKNFRTFTTKDGLPDNSILKVHGDNSGRVYFTPFTHYLHYYENDSFFKVAIPEKYKLKLANVVYFANRGNKLILCGDNEGFILEDNKLLSVHDMYNSIPEESQLRATDSFLIAYNRDSLFFIYDSGEIKRYSRYEKDPPWTVLENGPDTPDKLPRGSRWKPALNLSIYVPDSLVYHRQGNVVGIFSIHSGDLKYRLKIDKLSGTYVDNENNLWLTTVGNGVYRLPSLEFRNISFGNQHEIFSLLQIDRHVLAGTDYSKLFSIPVANPQSTYHTTDFTRFLALSHNPVSKLTGRNRIYILQSDGHDLYIGTDAFFLKKAKSKEPVFRDIYAIKDIDVLGEKLLVATSYRLYLMDKQEMKVVDTLLKQRATCAAAYQGNYYAGTLGGLVRINGVTKKITELYTTHAPFRGRITALKRGIDGDLWIATSGSGLVRFKDDKIIQVLKEQDGLTSDICTNLHIDSSLVWLGTNKGLNRIETHKKGMPITRFTTANGLGDDFINAVVATDSNVYVGTTAGLSVFSKNKLAEKSVCILHILQVSENNRQLVIDSTYSFPHNALNIRVNFTAISFKSAGDIMYYYQLKGLDDNWNMTTANFVNFPTLQPASYTLLLKAVNKFGVESDIRAIHITILEPWWQKWLFRLAVLLTIGLLILGVYWYNVRNIRRKEEMKREFEARSAALEQKALQAQMNPHFIFNSLNSIQTFILNLDVEGANNYLTRFASLIRQTLENSMHPLITVASELKYLETYLGLEKLRFRDKFSYEIRVDESIDQNSTMLPGMLLQPYVENSLRHGIQHRKDNNGLISLTIRKAAGNSIIYTIMDNGVGRKRAKELRSSRHIEYQSRGTSINEKRIAAINNQFNTNIRVDTEDIVENGTVAGTTVTVLIPMLNK